MKRILAAVVVLGGVLLLTDAHVRGGGQGGKTALEGTWGVTEIEDAGKKEPAPKGAMTIAFKGGSMTIKKGAKYEHEGTFKVDASKKPRQIDMTKKGEKPVTVQGIYEVNGDDLKLGVPATGPKGKRPTAFDAPGTLIIHLKRQK